MYINYDLLFKKGLTAEDYHTLIQINQKEHLLLEGKDLSKYEELNLVDHVKGEEKYKTARLTKNGRVFLDSLSTKGFTDEVGTLLKKLSDTYESYSKDTGNLLEVRNRLIWFIESTGFGPKAIFNAVDEYLTNSGDYTMNLDNLIWRAPSKAFSIHYNLKDSKLFDLISKQFNFTITFFLEDRTSVEDRWLQAVSQLEIPKRLTDKSLYFTGDYKTEVDFQKRLKQLYFKKIQNHY